MGMLEPVIVSLGYELVDIELRLGGRNGVVRLFIDSADGITLDDCEVVSRQVSGVLDVEDVIRQQYNLEVSSPGMDRKLVKPGDFDRFAGSRIRAQLKTALDGRRRFTGLLLRREGDQVVVQPDDQGDGELRTPIDNIETMRLVPDL